MPDIKLAPGAEEAALAGMLADMLRGNLENKPERVKDFNALNISIGIEATDAETQITLAFANGKLTVHKGLVNPGIVITTDSTSLLELAALNIKYGMPWYFDEKGMAVVKKLLKREVKIKGLLVHPLALTRLTKVMSVA